MKLGIVGTGAIGSEVVRAAARWDGIDSITVLDIRREAVERVRREVPSVHVAQDLGALVAGADVVVEAAVPEAAKRIVPASLEAGKDTLMMSIGALVDEAFYREMRRLAEKTGAKLYLPSGAIAGIDGLRAAAVGGIKSVTLVTSKSPASLGVDADRWTLMFSGPAREAIERFPKNVNIAVCLSLAGIGADDTWVQIVADPLAVNNEHKLIVEGTFGRLRLELTNLPHPDNPKTSYLASLSAIATLRRMIDPVQIGA